MPSRADWLTKLPALKPGTQMHVYPAEGLTIEAAKLAMQGMGYNMRHYYFSTHGNAVIVRRWSEVQSKPQNVQPEFKGGT